MALSAKQKLFKENIAQVDNPLPKFPRLDPKAFTGVHYAQREAEIERFNADLKRMFEELRTGG